jgi:fatty acid desaturase
LQDGSYDLSAAPPFGLSDIREAIPKQCWEKNGFKSMAYLAADVAIVTGLAAGAFALNQVMGVVCVLCSQCIAALQHFQVSR